MAGARQFDLEDAEYRAALAFWRHGFAGTSLSELEAATGLNRSSLYNTFGPKEALFERAVARYGAVHGTPAMAALKNPRVKEAIRGFFQSTLGTMTDAETPDGCLAALSCLEMGIGAEGAETIQARQIHRVSENLRAALSNAVGESQLPEDTDVEGLALTYTTLVRGLAAMQKGGAAAEELTHVVETAVRLLDAPPRRRVAA